MFGKNPIRPAEFGEGLSLKVVNLFATLQGEGPYVGYPAIFIRLGGCNLACDFCDTEFEQFRETPLSEILATTHKLAEKIRTLVVITGGEPLRQNISPLCEALIADGFTVQIETNGTLWRDLPAEVSVVCSPKMSHGKYHPLRDDVLRRAQALKFIVSANREDYREVSDVGQSTSNTPVYVQPMDEYDPQKNAANIAHAAQLAQANGYRLSLQMHKFVGIP